MNLLVATGAATAEAVSVTNSPTNLLLICVVLFIVGALQDWSSAIWLRCVNAKRRGWATFISIAHTFVSYLIWFKLSEQYLTSGDLIPLIVYSMAGGLGTFVGLGHKIPEGK